MGSRMPVRVIGPCVSKCQRWTSQPRWNRISCSQARCNVPRNRILSKPFTAPITLPWYNSINFIVASFLLSWIFTRMLIYFFIAKTLSFWVAAERCKGRSIIAAGGGLKSRHPRHTYSTTPTVSITFYSLSAALPSCGWSGCLASLFRLPLIRLLDSCSL